MSIKSRRKTVKPTQAEVHIRDCGDCGLSVELGTTPSSALSAKINALRTTLQDLGIPGISALVPGFGSLLVTYDPITIGADDLKPMISGLVGSLSMEKITGRQWRIPVCYDKEAGLDLDDVAKHLNGTTGDVIALHTGQSYQVFMMGFLPGFPYCGDLPTGLQMSRLTTPRTSLPIGSVAIAEQLTAIYPMESPGGWRILGNCPLPLFDPVKMDPCLFSPGDIIRFSAVKRKDHDNITKTLSKATFDIERECLVTPEREI